MRFRFEQEVYLSEMKPGESALLLSLNGEREEKLRLMTLGLLPGQRVTLSMKDPTGSILVFSFRGVRLAMTKESAHQLKGKRIK